MEPTREPEQQDNLSASIYDFINTLEVDGGAVTQPVEPTLIKNTNIRSALNKSTNNMIQVRKKRNRNPNINTSKSN